MLARYSTEFPCLTAGIVNAGKLQAEAFRDFALHIVLETLPRQPRPYNVERQAPDRRGPRPELPQPAQPAVVAGQPGRRVPDFDDGVDEPTGKGTQRVATGFLVRDGASSQGTPGEYDLYRQLLAPSLGVSPDQVGDLGPLLLSPMARGAQVSMR